MAPQSVSESWDIFVIGCCLAGIVDPPLFALVTQTVVAVAPLGAFAQIIIKLIDQAPAILQAAGILAATLLGLYNARKLNQVQAQTNGHMTTLLAKNDELHTMQTSLASALAASVPASAVTEVITATTERAGRAADRAGRRAEDAAATPVVPAPGTTTDKEKDLPTP